LIGVLVARMIRDAAPTPAPAHESRPLRPQYRLARFELPRYLVGLGADVGKSCSKRSWKFGRRSTITSAGTSGRRGGWTTTGAGGGDVEAQATVSKAAAQISSLSGSTGILLDVVVGHGCHAGGHAVLLLAGGGFGPQGDILGAELFPVPGGSNLGSSGIEAGRVATPPGATDRGNERQADQQPAAERAGEEGERAHYATLPCSTIPPTYRAGSPGRLASVIVCWRGMLPGRGRPACTHVCS